MTSSTVRAGRSTQLPAPPEGRDCWTVHIYPHTHWDREWYLSFERFRMQLVAAIDRILDTLEADPSFPTYVLDGQTIVLDDYLAMRPERKPQLARMIESGRIEIGPWYILPDEFLVSGESLVRNLMQGRRDARRHCEPLGVGYLPDPFGHVAQMPQVLRGFGIGSIVFSRGMGDEFETLGSEFEWVAPDGESAVLAIVQTATNTNGYCNGELLSYYVDPDEPRLYDNSEVLARHLASKANTDLLLFAAGSDHQTINPNLPEVVARLNRQFDGAQFVISGLGPAVARAERYVAERAAAGRPVGRHAGELRGSLHAPILGGIFSARIPLKQQNAQLQTWLERYTEPLAALATVTGAWKTPRAFIDHAWRLALQNQPHDSIGGCSVDAVHDEMPARTLRALELCRGIQDELKFALGVEREDMVFNPNGTACGGIVTLPDGSATRVAEVPALALVPLEEALDDGGAHVVDESTIQASHIRVAVAGGGVRVTLRSADGSDQVVIDDALSFVDRADAGDEYDFGHVAGDSEIVAELTDWHTHMAGPGVAELVLRHCIDLPSALNEERTARTGTLIEHQLVTTMRIADDIPWVECVTAWHNESSDHRLRVRTMLDGHAAHSAAGGHFAVLERPTAPPAHRPGWKQQPLPSHHCEGFASIETGGDTGHGVALFTRGLHEYEATGTALDVTVLRSIGWLSREDIVGRPGHAGPAMETPGAQCIGPMRVEYAIAPFVGSWQSAGVYAHARRYMAPPMLSPAVHPSLSPEEGIGARKRDILLDVGPHGVGPRALREHGLALAGVELSTLKLAEDDSGDLVVRCFNPTRETRTARLHVPATCTSATDARLDETPGERLALAGRDVSFEVPAGAIRTVRLSFGG